MRVLAIGECMAELAPADGPKSYTLGFAGDTFNTIWYLAQHAPGISAAYYTALGTDPISQDMRCFMQGAGIDDSLITTVRDRTIGLYLISLNKGERSFSYWRGQSAARCLADDPAALTAAVASADMVYLSGITLAILEPDARARLLSAMDTARAAGKTILFDPNLRPKLWATPQDMTRAIMDGAAVCDIALPSFEDEADWFADASPEATIDRYAQAGAKKVIVKNGAGTIHYQDGVRQGQVTVIPALQMVDTTAAGDSFNAGVMAGLARGADLPSCINLGARLASHVIQHKGALVPLTAAQAGLQNA